MAAPLSDLTYYLNRSLGGLDSSDVNSSRGQDALRAVQQYDPNASYQPIYGSDGQLNGYSLSFDRSKLPGTDGSGSLGNSGGESYQQQTSFSTVQPHMQLNNPSAVTNSPVYGTITDNTNIGTPSSLLDTLGPAAVLGFGALMGGMPFLTQGIMGGGNPMAGATPFDSLPGYNPTYGDMLPFNPSDADLGLSGAANAPLGSAESSLYGSAGAADPGQALGGAFDPNLQVGGPLGMTQGYEQMAPFNPASPEYGQFAINPDGTPAAGAGGLPGSGLKMPSLSDITSALGKIPGLSGSGSGGGSGGGGGGLLNMPPSQYGALTTLLKRYMSGGLLNG